MKRQARRRRRPGTLAYLRSGLLRLLSYVGNCFLAALRRIERFLRYRERRADLKRLANYFRWPYVPREYITSRKILNFWRCQIAWLLAREKVSGHPYQLVLELTNVCNLRCPHCPTGQGNFGRKPSYMDLKRLDQIMDELGPYAFMTDLHNWGEPMLHAGVYDAIRIIEKHRVMTVMSTNFNVPFDEAKAEALVRSGLSVLGLSLDGPDQETYEKYRVRGKLALALENARLVVEAKKRLHATKPNVIWCYLVFRHNQHKVNEASALAEKMGLEFSARRGFAGSDPSFETTDNWGHPALDLLSQGPSCRFLYSMAALNADLGVSPCCSDVAFTRDTDFGDVRTRSFREIWNGSHHRAARRVFRGLTKPARHDNQPSVCCENCPVYEVRQKQPSLLQIQPAPN
jgi:MoaA/NifB/PqqE/SkfB family radical SAM enzyme